MSVDSGSIAQVARFVKPCFPGVFSLRSTLTIPHPPVRSLPSLRQKRLLDQLDRFRLFASTPVISHTSGELSRGFGSFFCGGRKTRSTRRFLHRLPTPPAFQWSCPILKKTTKSQRVRFTPGKSDFWIENSISGGHLSVTARTRLRFLRRRGTGAPASMGR